jgi:hypothetical protein
MWAWFQRLWQRLSHAVITGAQDVDNNSTKIVSTYESIITDSLNLVVFLRDLEHFNFNPAWKTRVINVPRAGDAINELFDLLFHGLRDRFQVFHNAVLDLKNALEGQGPGQHFPDGNSAMGKVVSYVGDLDVAWRNFGIAYHSAVDLVSLVDQIKQRIETLDDLFLPQSNVKKTVDEHYRKRQRQ